VIVAPDLSEIVVPGSQSGTFDRQIRTFDVGGTFAKSGALLTASFSRDRADDPIFRTDFLDRDRMRLRAGWLVPGERLRMGISMERVEQNNNRTDTGYDANFRQHGADAELTPAEWLRVRASWSDYRAESIVTIRRPETFVLDRSSYKERGHTTEGGLTLLRSPFSVDASLARMENRGALPFDIDRYRLRLTWDIKPSTGLAAEWSEDQYDEAGATFTDFQARRYGLYLRWKP
jgi:hypothetical protein